MEKRITHHVKICKNYTGIELIEARKRCYELIDVYECNWHSEILEKKFNYDLNRGRIINRRT